MKVGMEMDTVTEGLDDVGDRSLPQQGQRFIKRARTEEEASKTQFSLAATSCLTRPSFKKCIQELI